MEVDLLQFPTKENEHTAICRATAKTANGGLFIDVGDANPMNCNSKVARHIIRMASTRAKARCLRDLTNIGMTCLEELGDLTEVIGAEDEPGEPLRSRRTISESSAPKQAQVGKQLNREMAKEGNPRMKIQYPIRIRLKRLCRRIRLYYLLRKQRRTRQRLNQRVENLKKHLKSQPKLL